MEYLTKEYTLLFAGISTALIDLAALSQQLTTLQQTAEELFVERADTDSHDKTSS